MIETYIPAPEEQFFRRRDFLLGERIGNEPAAKFQVVFYGIRWYNR